MQFLGDTDGIVSDLGFVVGAEIQKCVEKFQFHAGSFDNQLL